MACPVGDPCVSRLVIGQDTAYLVSWHEAKHQAQLLAIDATGRVKPGWPVALDHSYGWFSAPQLGSDGTIFIDTKPGADDGPSALWALAPDGSRRQGWPISMPGWGNFSTRP
jgi:outer membrane protein assembly factor BamB